MKTPTSRETMCRGRAQSPATPSGRARPSRAKIGMTLGGLLLVAASACGPEGSVPVSGPESNAVGQARTGGQGPPPMGPTILVAPSPSSYVLEFAQPPSPGLLQNLAVQYGLSLVESEPQFGGTAARFDGPIGLDLAAVRQTVGAQLTGSSVNLPVFLSEGSSLTGGFVVGEWDDDQLASGGLEALDLAQVHTQARGAGARVAVLDTGADLLHPFLQGRVVAIPNGKSLVSQELLDGMDEDADGSIDEAYGHGTHVAGIVLQVAPDAVIIPIRVLNSDGVGSLWDLLSGLEIARVMGATIVNLSISMHGWNDLVELRAGKGRQVGITVVAAAGNGGFSYPTYPGVSPNAVGVAAIDASFALASFSGGGGEIRLAAPGVSIQSAYPGGLMASASGTSMATAVVSGAVALMKDGLGQTPEQGAATLCSTVQAISPSDAVSCGIVSPIDALTSRLGE